MGAIKNRMIAEMEAEENNTAYDYEGLTEAIELQRELRSKHSFWGYVINFLRRISCKL